MKFRLFCDMKRCQLIHSFYTQFTGLHGVVSEKTQIFMPVSVYKCSSAFHIVRLFQADRLAAGLLQLGLSPGDRLGIWGPNSSEWFISRLAAARAGLVAVSNFILFYFILYILFYFIYFILFYLFYFISFILFHLFYFFYFIKFILFRFILFHFISFILFYFISFILFYFILFHLFYFISFILFLLFY